jgi:hypothetical protein
VDAHRRHVARDGDGAALERRRADPGEDVAAGLGVGDDRLIDEDLEEQIVDVGISPRRRRQDRDLGRQRVGAADAVDLARIRRAEDAQEKRVPRRRIPGQVGREEVGAL